MSARLPYIPASKPRSARAVIYLDLDGVLHHEAVVWDPRRGVYMSQVLAPGRTLFEWSGILEEVLRPFPEVALVLSSSWGIRVGYAATIKQLPTNLRRRFIGGTYHSTVHGANPWCKSDFMSEARGAQVCADVERRRPHSWIALDDDAKDWPEEALDHLIQCDGTVGLSDVQVQRKLCAWLRSIGTK